MTTHTITTPTDPDRPCQLCNHSMDAHVLLLVRETPAPMGLIVCPVPECDCGSTWRAGAGRSTAAEIAQTRALVRQTLQDDGYVVPPWLR